MAYQERKQERKAVKKNKTLYDHGQAKDDRKSQVIHRTAKQEKILYMTHHTAQEGNKYHHTGNNQLVNWTVWTQGEPWRAPYGPRKAPYGQIESCTTTRSRRKGMAKTKSNEH